MGIRKQQLRAQDKDALVDMTSLWSFLSTHFGILSSVLLELKCEYIEDVNGVAFNLWATQF